MAAPSPVLRAQVIRTYRQSIQVCKCAGFRVEGRTVGSHTHAQLVEDCNQWRFCEGSSAASAWGHMPPSEIEDRVTRDVGVDGQTVASSPPPSHASAREWSAHLGDAENDRHRCGGSGCSAFTHPSTIAARRPQMAGCAPRAASASMIKFIQSSSRTFSGVSARHRACQEVKRRPRHSHKLMSRSWKCVQGAVQHSACLRHGLAHNRAQIRSGPCTRAPPGSARQDALRRCRQVRASCGDGRHKRNHLAHATFHRSHPGCESVKFNKSLITQ